jgi:hypothetical protein
MKFVENFKILYPPLGHCTVPSMKIYYISNLKSYFVAPKYVSAEHNKLR